MYIAALDQGTTSSRTVLFGKNASVAATHQIEYRQIYPRPGYVEHDPDDIFNAQIDSLSVALQKAGARLSQIEAIAIANQRETCIVWDRRTGRHICNAIVWQCRRTSPMCESLISDGLSDIIQQKTGLVIDAYFSATKLAWILDNIPGARARAEKGELCFGTVDSYLLWRLTGGKSHKTDVSNASRTMLFNIHDMRWDDELLRLFNIPENMLPQVVDTAGLMGVTDKEAFGREIPIMSMAGDQQAALYGQLCHTPGMIKNTYGTGCFMLMNTGDTPVDSDNRLLTTVAWRINGKTSYALEGSVFMAGAVVKWLRDELAVIRSADETEGLAASVESTCGVYFVPAFTGLGAPYWDMYARGALVGLTRGSGRAHIVRAALESIAFQCCDVAAAMEADCGMKPPMLRVDGGAAANRFLMQFQADLLGLPVHRPDITETTALGAAMLAGLYCGFWDKSALAGINDSERVFVPSISRAKAAEHLDFWKKAVARARGWAAPSDTV